MSKSEVKAVSQKGGESTGAEKEKESSASQRGGGSLQIGFWDIT